MYQVLYTLLSFSACITLGVLVQDIFPHTLIHIIYYRTQLVRFSIYTTTCTRISDPFCHELLCQHQLDGVFCKFVLTDPNWFRFVSHFNTQCLFCKQFIQFNQKIVNSFHGVLELY